MRMQIKSRDAENGQAIMEFVLCALFLVPALAGAFTVGMSLTKAIQASQVCRDANVLAVRGIDMSQAESKRLVVRTAKGLSMGLPSGDPDTAGKAVVILSQVLRVGANECDSDTPALTYPGGTCTNYGYYVFTNRIVVGNPSQFTSTIGNPAGPLAANGDISLRNYLTLTGNRAAGFPANTFFQPAPPAVTPPAVSTYVVPPWAGLVYLDLGGSAFISEAAFDISDINIFSILSAPKVYARNVS